MKKLMTLTLCGLTALALNAQVATVEQAKKLAGKPDKIEEARALIQEAIANPETANQANTYYVAGKIEWDAYDKQKAAGVDTLKRSQELLNGYNYYLQVFPLDELPNEKGEVKPKFTKNLQKSIKEKQNDFWDAGAIFYNNQNYDKAYEAFMIFGDMPDLNVLGKEKPQTADTIRALSYYNAGTSAEDLRDFDKAILAFSKAVDHNYTSSDALSGVLRNWQKIQMTYPERKDEAKQHIYEIAEIGYSKYGVEPQHAFLANIINHKADAEQYDEAIGIINDALSQDPNNNFLYSLRGFVYERMGNEEGALNDYIAAAENPKADMETLKKVILTLIKIGQKDLNEVELNDPNFESKRNAIKEKYLVNAHKYVERAKKINEKDPNLSDLVENLDYLMGL